MPPTATPGPAPSEPPGLQLGSLLGGRYRLDHLIGRGGMAAVYQARDMGGIKRDVAIKVLLPQAALSEETVQRFHLEADTIAGLEHPNIIKLYDKGQTPDGVVYLVMELLRGETLAATFERLRAEGRVFSWERLAPILMQLCDALHAAHQAKIVHRDIKPSNCFRTEYAGARAGDFIKVLDFGIAKVRPDWASGNHGPDLKTNENLVLGTIHYVSPEAIEETDEPIDGRADMFAVGVMMYQFLTGTLPFEGSSKLDVLFKTAHTRPEPPRQRAPHANIPPEVEAIILRAMEIDRTKRYSSMRDMSAAIHAVPRDERVIIDLERSVKISVPPVPINDPTSAGIATGNLPITAAQPLQHRRQLRQFIGPAVLLSGGLVLWLAGPSSSERAESSTEPTTQPPTPQSPQNPVPPREERATEVKQRVESSPIPPIPDPEPPIDPPPVPTDEERKRILQQQLTALERQESGKKEKCSIANDNQLFSIKLTLRVDTKGRVKVSSAQVKDSRFINRRQLDCIRALIAKKIRVPPGEPLTFTQMFEAD